MMAIFVIIVIVGPFIGLCALTCCPFLKTRKENLKKPKIKFKDFQKWYLLCPTSYILKAKTISRIGLGEFRFGVVDTIRYKIWKNKERHRYVKKKNIEQVRLLLSYVEHDIEAYENETRKEIEKLG